MHPHLLQLHRALRDEEDHQRREHDRLAALSREDRIAAGLTWAPVRFELEESWHRGKVQMLVRGALHQGIGPGDTVEVAGRRGRCVGRDPEVAELMLDGEEEEIAGDAVERCFDPSTLVRYRQILEQVDALESPLKTALLEGDTTSEPPEHDWGPLDPSQARAASRALGAVRLGLLHGPPGTGKTRVLVALLRALVEEGDRPWGLAESNAAADHLAVSAHKAGLDVVRIGSTFRMSGPAAELSLEARVRNGPQAVALAKLEAEIRKARSARGPPLWRLLDERRELRRLARAQVLDHAQVFAMTLGTVAARFARPRKPGQPPPIPMAHTAVVDEVTQALEPAVWAVVPYVQRLILAGDPHQLGPVVTQPGNPLGRGLLQRLADQGATLPMLETQYRMSAAIQALVHDVYGPTYQPHPSVADHRLEGRTPVLWIDTAGAGEELRDPVTRSVYNPLEIQVVARLLQQLRQADPSVSIGVIAPYSAQVQRLSRLPEAAGVEVATVNAFQGREADAIVLSLTRSNLDGELGFVVDRRRLTVGLTRARKALVLVGDSATLALHPMFASLLASCPVESVWEEGWVDLIGEPIRPV